MQEIRIRKAKYAALPRQMIFAAGRHLIFRVRHRNEEQRERLEEALLVPRSLAYAKRRENPIEYVIGRRCAGYSVQRLQRAI